MVVVAFFVGRQRVLQIGKKAYTDPFAPERQGRQLVRRSDIAPK